MTELELIAYEALKSAGIKKGHFVLDFGCGRGTYTIPAARIVGRKGKVFALDKSSSELDNLVKEASLAGLNNIERMDTSGNIRFNLADESIDVVLIFDVLNIYYFPSKEGRLEVLKESKRVLKSDGLLLVYPKHIESQAESEVRSAGFRLESRYSGKLIHLERDLESGEVLTFRKVLNHSCT
jgi:ubiquinone/menaquinone biosynthesis C-methylase UbiE